jgi:hypothetical protein
MIILTHNFDFFRTLESRGVSSYNSCLIAIKNNDNIELQKFTGLKNPFIKDWIEDLTDNKKLIASIPFVRNIIEYTRGTEDIDYLNLTSLLHVKDETKNITLNNIKDIFEKNFPELNFSSINSNTKVLDLIFETADECLNDPEGINLEQKIVLSIAIRLKAEQFMINQIDNEEFYRSIKRDQTYKLLNRYRNKFLQEKDNIKLLERVVLMTPKQIHINSFMYEPLIDMGYSELKNLYGTIKDQLNSDFQYSKLKELHVVNRTDNIVETSRDSE